MAFLDVDRRFTKVNASCTMLWGYSEAELLERGIFDLLAPGDETAVRNLVAEIDAEGVAARLALALPKLAA